MYRIGASYALSEADLRFDGEDDYQLEQHAVAAFVSRRFGERFTVQLTLGAILDGQLAGQGRRFDVDPGFLVSASGAYRFLGAPGDRVFGTGTFGYGMSFASTRESVDGAESVSLGASDARVGVLLGATLGETVSPFLAARAFGGPVSWELDGKGRTGSDRHHYALGAGVVVNLHERLDLTVDASFFGERTIAAALSFSL